MAKNFELIFIFYLINVLLLVGARNVGRCRPLRGPEGIRCTGPDANWQRDGTCIEDGRKMVCEVPDTRNFRFRLVAELQEKGSQTIENLWVRGSGPQLSWDKPRQLRQSAGSGENSWSIDISYTSDSDGIPCPDNLHCTFNQKALELRFYKSELKSDDMKGPNFYIPLPISNSMEGTVSFISPRVEVFPWFDSTTVRVERFQLSCSSIICNINSPVTSTILYPPSFNSNIYKKYPLVLMFGAKEATLIIPQLEHMYAYEATIEEAVVVSIHYLGPAPFCTFNPYDQILSTAETGTIWRCRLGDIDCYHCQNCWDYQRPIKCSRREFLSKARNCLERRPCKGAAGDILDFIELTLLPELQERTMNRLKLDFPRQRISVIGYSGTGLFACHAALSRPFYYGNAACMSAPFHWPLSAGAEHLMNNRSTEGIGALLSELAVTMQIDPDKKGLYSTQKYYIDTGEEDNHFRPYIDGQNYSQWMINLLTKTLPLPPENILYFNVPGAGNNDVHFRDGKIEMFNRIRQPLFFFFKSPGGPNEEYSRIPHIDERTFTNYVPSTDEYQLNKSETNHLMVRCAFDKRTQTGIQPQVFALSICKIFVLKVYM